MLLLKLSRMDWDMRNRILAEIRNFADLNGGKAPGKGVFARETGIQESDWSGKYWTRWNDAVLEAGLLPNQRQGRFSDDFVLEKYAQVCRHFGRPPTNAELRLYVRETPDFISHNTFAKHFGTKNGVIAALHKWASKRNDVELIAVLPEPVGVQESKSSEANQNRSGEGYVYLLKSGEHYKIGRSTEIEKRIKQISISLPEPVELVHTIKTDDPSGIESYWHRRFDDQRAGGEWFKLGPAELKAFKRRKFQ